jgi:hypothetical protein
MQNLETWQEQRMSDEEAQQVLRILAERQRQSEELSGRPTVQDVAALANAPINEVAAALNEVRSQTPAVTQPRRKQLLPLIAAATIAFVLLGAGAMFVFTANRTVQTSSTPLPYPPGADTWPPPSPQATSESVAESSDVAPVAPPRG